MKRKRSSHAQIRLKKRQCLEQNSSTVAALDDAVLRAHYPVVQSLRSYFLSIPSAAARRKQKHTYHDRLNVTSDASIKDAQHDLDVLLDSTLVGSFRTSPNIDVSEEADRAQELIVYSQKVVEGTPGLLSCDDPSAQAQVVDFLIWSLFRKYSSTSRPPHLLCHGYSRCTAGGTNGVALSVAPGIPGLLSYSPNQYVERLKTSPWDRLPSVIGKGHHRVLTDLLMDCGLFVPVTSGSRGLLQISGTPLPDLQTLSAVKSAQTSAPVDGMGTTASKRSLPPSSIRFVRHRMLYGKPILNAKGNVTFGLRPIHLLNRTKALEPHDRLSQLVQYIFPRQCGLHNAFTSTVNGKESAQPFVDYTLRDQELKRHAMQKNQVFHIPKRLRGQAQVLIEAIGKRHKRCSYSVLLQQYCPVPLLTTDQQDQRVFRLATPVSSVSAYCRSVINHVFPSALWGDDAVGKLNRTHIMKAADHFVQLRRYESMTLQDVLRDVKVSAIPWLNHSNHKDGQKMSSTDHTKRREMLAEVVFYLFDSFLIPLISSTFHVTESSAHRNQLFYFRHDVWKHLSEPALSEMRTTMFDELKPQALKSLLTRKALGTSRVRLLPKDSGLRPIINLRRRVMTLVNGKMVLGKSINSAMTPVFHVLNLEKTRQPDKLGSSIFSADEIYPRLQIFRSQLNDRGVFGKPLYFVKADVRSCFDTIPQGPLLQVIKKLLVANEYAIGRYAEAKIINRRHFEQAGVDPKVVWKFHGKALPAGQDMTLSQLLQELDVDDKPGSVYVDSVVRQFEGRKKIVNLLEEHVQRNLVQIGKKYYRQKTGIPQGSIVSTLLCSLFYAELEQQMLGFVKQGETLLLRLIDDFLLITTNKDIAGRFVKVLHQGIAEFGVSIKKAKSRVNFDIDIDGEPIAKLPAATDFPWCGNAINTVSLNISKDKERRITSNIKSAITVEYSKLQGQTFYRKILGMLKMHMHAMLLSTSFNDISTVMGNLYHGFVDVAERCLYYIKSLSADRQPSPRLVIRTVDDLMRLALATMQKKNRKSASQAGDYSCCITRSQTRWLQDFDVRR